MIESAPGRRKSSDRVVLETRVVTGAGGGPDKTILNSPRHLWSGGYRTICAYMHPPGDPGFDVLRSKAVAAEAPLVSIPDRGPWDWRVISQYLSLCRRERVAIWHGHDYKSNALGLLVRRFWPMRLVTTVHGWVKQTRRTPLYYRIDEICLPRYEAVVCVSEDLHSQALQAGVKAERCVLVENAIDLKDYTRQTSGLVAKEREQLKPDRLVFGAVGRLSAEKGFDLLIRAAHRLVQGGLDIQVVIVGEGDAEPQLRILIRELGLEDRVRLPGYRADPRPIYEAMDVYVLSSIREGLPNVVLEAMAMETPVIATRIAGVPRVIQDGGNGLLINSGSVDELAAAMGRLARDPEERARLAAAARKTVVERYSFATRMEKIRALYDKLLSQRNGARSVRRR